MTRLVTPQDSGDIRRNPPWRELGPPQLPSVDASRGCLPSCRLVPWISEAGPLPRNWARTFLRNRGPRGATIHPTKALGRTFGAAFSRPRGPFWIMA